MALGNKVDQKGISDFLSSFLSSKSQLARSLFLFSFSWFGDRKVVEKSPIWLEALIKISIIRLFKSRIYGARLLGR